MTSHKKKKEAKSRGHMREEKTKKKKRNERSKTTKRQGRNPEEDWKRWLQICEFLSHVAKKIYEA